MYEVKMDHLEKVGRDNFVISGNAFYREGSLCGKH